MKFLDTAKIKVISGKGGNGIVAWRREKYEPRGGPAGGDGGKGGSVYFQADHNLSTLLDFQYKSKFKASDGQRGGTSNKTGRSGDDLIIKVPCGTIIKDLESGEVVADLCADEQKVLIAEGGKGGKGNSKFATSTRQAPHFCEPGEPEIERDIELELKLIAEVGIIGLPNAGKSTLISVISSAKPKIADYPFTTITPNLGVVKKPDGDGLLVADIPGLIKGASEGQGLGHDFMKHVERTKILVHVVDGASFDGIPPLEAYDTIQSELKNYNSLLASKKQILVINKIDVLLDEQIEELKDEFKKRELSPLFISSATKKNIDLFLETVFKELEEIPVEEVEVQTYYDPKATDHKTDDFNVYKDEDCYIVEGRKIHGLLSVTDLKDYQSMGHLMGVLKNMGVFQELESLGAEEGNIVYVHGVKFEFSPETMILT